MRQKIAIVCHKNSWRNRLLPVMEMFEQFFDVTWFYIDDHGWPSHVSAIPEYNKQDGIIWFVGFKHLLCKQRRPFDWGQYFGCRIMYDFDSYQNYSRFASVKYHGRWPDVFRLHNFDTLICTSKQTSEAFCEDGINAVWIPKAFDEKRFRNKGRKRRGLCYFGRKYPVRMTMLDVLEKAGIPANQFRCSFFSLADYLNQYKACVMYNGPEPMQKFFESAASGCVPVCNNLAELRDLGFRDGKTMVTYFSFDELVQKMQYYLRKPELLYEIGAASAQLAADCHTWNHRAERFKDLL